VPETLEKRRLPYTGCPADVLRLGLDKVNVKVMLRSSGILTPDFQVLNPRTLSSFRLSFPCIVKPRRDDASHGISDASVVHNREELVRQVTALSVAYPTGVLVEQFLPGREFNATVTGGADITVLPVSEIVYTLPPEKPQLLTFAAKWETGSPEYAGTNAVCPAEVSPEEMEHLRETARFVFLKLVGRGYARVDMRMDANGILHVIEINPNPDLSPDAGAAIQAAAAGLSYTDFIASIVKLAAKAVVHAG
jgi:D-alanine-D-alanine ligase